MIQAVIIDFDDTLCLTESACFVLENESLAKMGRPLISRAMHTGTWGQPLFEAITIRSPGINVEEFKAVYHPIIADHTANGKLDAIPEANYKALDALIALGKIVFILTSRTHGEVRHLLEPDHLLASRVKAFYYKDNMQFHKPDPRAFTELLADSGLRPECCVYVGDSVGDAVASKKAGLKFVASLESGLREKQDFTHAEADAYIYKPFLKLLLPWNLWNTLNIDEEKCTMKAMWNKQVIAEANNDDLIRIEGNWYFPPDAVNKNFFKPSDLHTTCFWKGEASYYNIDVDGEVNEGGAWYYPQPMDGSIERVKKDFTNYIAFWRGVEVSE